MEPKRMSTDRRLTASGRGSQRAATLVGGGQTGGQLALLELVETAGDEPPRHLHTGEDEIIYVLEGELTVYIGVAVHRAVSGTCLVLPRGVEHAYVVVGREARLLTAFTPAGLEEYVHEFGGETDHWDLERMVVTAARYGVTIIGSTREDGANDSDG